ncbi:MAG: PIN domain nuclease [Reyranellaceae bacterium]
MIVVDSSVWIASLRRQASRAVLRLQAAVENEDDQILVGDLILLEVLQGARDDAHAARIERNLRNFPIVSMLDETIAVRAARNHRRLRARGITVRRTIDMIIGTFCLAGGHALLHDDRDFDPLATHLGLQVVST